ncbi:MAG: hypothetical protein ABFD60_01450 [Bryobacteraceae bacterium]
MHIADRVAAYRAKFPQYSDSWPHGSRRWLSATWMLGNDYRGSGYYGAYPPGYLKRMAPMFTDCPRVLHLFSGSLPPGPYVRVDTVRPAEYNLNAERQLLEAFGPNAFDIIYADPPYSPDDAWRYDQQRMINRRKVLAQCHAVLAPGGNLAWMDVILPMYRGDQWIH